MKIAIEARSLSAKGGGVKMYTQQLISSLLSLHTSDDFVLLYDSPRSRGSFPNTHEEVLPLWPEAALPWWLSHTVAARVKALSPDIVHYTKSAVPKTISCPTVVTIHDIIPILYPSSQAWLRRLYWPQALRHAALTAHHILTVSESSKRDIVRLLNVPPEKISAIPLAVNTSRFQSMAKPAHQKPYILLVATRDQRKNVGSLLQAFARIAHDIPHQLVVAGKPALKADEAVVMANTFPESVTSRIQFVDFVPEGELPALYARADLFVWPSVYEGWGLPPMEAMASGVPVIVSDGGALPEVVGEAGEIVRFSETDLLKRTQDEQFITALAERMLAVLTSQEKQRAMREAGLARVKKFTWDGVAKKTLEVYMNVAA